MWSDQYSRPTFGQYVLQPFIDVQDSFSLTIGPLNSKLLFNLNNVDTDINVAYGTYSPSAFVQAMNNAFSETGISVALRSIDTLRPEQLHVGKLRWTNAASGPITISVPDDDLRTKCATAATYGLYTLQPSGQTQTFPLLISNDEPPDNYEDSPSATIVQWPATWTIQEFTTPGSPDSDGLVRLYFNNTGEITLYEPNETYYASGQTYALTRPDPVPENSIWALNEGESFMIEAWGAGGGSIDPFTFGGPSARATMTIQLDAPIQTFDVTVGLKGTKNTPSRCTGGSVTSVVINGYRVLDIGGGGGSALGSHGGAAGAPRDADVSGAQSLQEFCGYSGSLEPFTSDDSLYTQILGPSGPTGANATQGGGCGIGANGKDGTFDIDGTPVVGRPGGLGGQGTIGFLLQESQANVFGGTGSGTGTPGQPAGAGGGGSTMLAGPGDYATYGFSVLDITLNPPWSFQGIVYGGGSGPRLAGNPDAYQVFEPVEARSNNFSLLSLVLSRLWTVQQQQVWTTGLLNALAQTVVNGSVATPDSSNNMLWPTDALFVNDATNTQTGRDAFNSMAYISSLVPVGPHDLFLPGQSGPNIRPITGDSALLNNNLTLCIHNDGQILPDSVPYYLFTSITGPGVPENTLVVGIRFGASVPQGLFAAIYLDLSMAIDNALGPFVWALEPLGPRAVNFTNGTAVTGTLAQSFDSSISLQSLYSDGLDSLVDSMYSVMQNVYLSSSETVEAYQPAITSTWPKDTTSGPTYLRDLWPVTTVNVRTFAKQVGAPPQVSFGYQKIVKFFEYTGAIQSITIPPWARVVTTTVFGAGGTSANETQRGSPGTCSVGTFRDLAGSTLTVHVGQGGSPDGSPTGLSGGLNAAGTVALGGGFSGIFKSQVPIIIGAGGGSAGTFTSGVREPTPDTKSLRDRRDGISGAFETENGYSNGGRAVDASSGAGGSGYRGGSSGLSGFSGASGKSLVPVNGYSTGLIESQKFWRPEIGFGSSGSAGHGLVVFEILY